MSEAEVINRKTVTFDNAWRDNAPVLVDDGLREQFNQALDSIANRVGYSLKVCFASHIPANVVEPKIEESFEYINIHPFAVPTGLTHKFSVLPKKVKFFNEGDETYEIEDCQTDLIDLTIPKDFRKAFFVNDKAKSHKLAIFTEHNVYVLFDALDCDPASETAEDGINFFIDVVTAALNAMKKNDMLVDPTELMKKRLKTLYASFEGMGNQFAIQQTQTLNNEVATLQSNITEYERALVGFYRDIHTKTIQLMVSKDRFSLRNLIGSEKYFEVLLTHYYRDIKFEKVPFPSTGNQDCLIAISRQVYIKDKGKIHSIGVLKVTIPFRADIPFTVHNIEPTAFDQSRNGLIHPHILNPNSVCLGSLKIPVAKLRANLNLAILLQTLGQYFHSYIETDCYNKLTLFPIVSDESVEKLLYDNEASLNGKTQMESEKVAIISQELEAANRRQQAVAQQIADDIIGSGT